MGTRPHRTDEELFARAAAGDEQAFAELYRRHASAMLGFCVRRLNDPGRATDVWSEVFASLAVRARSGKPAPESVAAWLYGVARNKILDAVRAGVVEQQAHARLGIPRLELSDEAVERVLEIGGDVRAVAALDALPEVQRQAVEARIVREEPYEEIARMQETTQATVRQRVARGLARLRAELEGHS